MRIRIRWVLIILLALWARGPAVSQVTLQRTPDGGIQPQAVTDAAGGVHLIYFKGDPVAGDIYYVRRMAGGAFSAPLRVNSQPGSAIAIGTIRGAQIAVGRTGRVFVAWNGSGRALPKGPGGTPMLFARLQESGRAFEAQRNLITWAGGLDGGGTLAADQDGRVYVAWHANPKADGEDHRAVYLARSTDDGRTFARERRINPDETGVCGCCALRAFVDRSGAVSLLYRMAKNVVQRDMVLLTSSDHGESFVSRPLDPWKLGYCPMSSSSIAQGRQQPLLAWETERQVLWGRQTTSTIGRVAAPGPGGARQHPVILQGAGGLILLAWTEGTGWERGGGLAWQVYDAAGRPQGNPGRAPGVPVWSLLAATADGANGFTLYY